MGRGLGALVKFKAINHFQCISCSSETLDDYNGSSVCVCVCVYVFKIVCVSEYVCMCVCA
jgi:hypothetical protein